MERQTLHSSVIGSWPRSRDALSKPWDGAGFGVLGWLSTRGCVRVGHGMSLIATGLGRF